MAFHLKTDESLGKGLRRIAREELHKALDALTGRTKDTEGERVHDARKRFKRVRAVLRLTREAIGRKASRREDRLLGDVARPLADLRDAAALLTALDLLQAGCTDAGDRQAIAVVRERLHRRKVELTRRLLDDQDTLENVAHAARDALDRVECLHLAAGDRSAIAAGLRAVYKRGRLAFEEARAHPTDERLHRFRKRVKDLWYSLSIFAPIRPRLAGMEAQAEQLSEALGDDHDLAVLGQLLPRLNQEPIESDTLERVSRRIRRRREELQGEAFGLAERVYNARARAIAKGLRVRRGTAGAVGA